MQAAIGEPEISTGDALKITGMSGTNWRTIIDKGLYTCAPPTVDGRRTWDRDSLVVLAWCDAVIASGMKRTLAASAAAELAKAIERHPRTKSFNVYAWERDLQRGGLSIGTQPPAEAPNAKVIFEVPVEDWRRNVDAAIASFYARKGAIRAAQRH